MKRISLYIAFFAAVLFYMPSLVAAADGWASENGGTTGGAGGTVVTVTNAADLKYYAELGTAPYIIQISGTINIHPVGGEPESLEISANKTLIGIGTNPTLIGNVGFNNRDGNIIIENLNITNPHLGSAYDGISLKQDIHNVLVTKCTFYDTGDGAFDISNNSDFITVSWCKFHYTPSAPDPGHTFACLVGSSDSQEDDAANLRVTYHHNWWTTGVKERMPRVRYGQVHVYNNYYSNLVAGGYCVGVGCGSRIRVENNYFNAVPMPWKDYYTGTGHPAGHIGWNTGNVFYNCSQPTWATNEYSTIFVPPYSYTLDNAADIPAMVQAYAGAGTPYPPPAAPTGLTATAGNQTISLDWDDNSEPDLAGYNVYRSTTQGSGYGKINTSLVTVSAYTDNNVNNGTPYYYVVRAVNTSSGESGNSNEASATPDFQTCADVIAGGFGFVSDINGDCYVNMDDLAVIALYWLHTDCAVLDNCENADLEPDGDVDFLDYSDFALDWLNCNNPQDSSCPHNW